MGQTTIIVSDAGHGGSDPGTLSGGIVEKDYQLQVESKVREKLQAEYVCTVVPTRTSDVDVSLSQRTQISNSLLDPVFLSYHHNATSSPAARGAEMYIYGPKSWVDAVSKDGTVNHRAKRSYALSLLMEPVLKKFCESHKLTWRGIKAGNFQVLRDTNCRGILFEAFYASSPYDVGVANSPGFVDSLVAAYVEAIAVSLNLEPRPKLPGDREQDYLISKAIIQEPIKEITVPLFVSVIARVLSKFVFKDGRF